MLNNLRLKLRVARWRFYIRHPWACPTNWSTLGMRIAFWNRVSRLFIAGNKDIETAVIFRTRALFIKHYLGDTDEH